MSMRMVVMLNRACNRRCNKCYLAYSGRRDPAKAPSLVARLRDQGFCITVAGSETLLEPRYLDAHQAAGQHYPFTNGLLLAHQPSLFARLARMGITDLHLSLDFFIERETGCVPEATVARILDDARHRSFVTKITSLVTTTNHLRVREMCDRASSYGARELQLIRPMPPRHRTSLCALPDVAADRVHELVCEGLTYRPEHLSIIMNGNFGPRRATRGCQLAAANTYCQSGTELFTLTPSNDVYGCSFRARRGMEIGVYDGCTIQLTRPIPISRATCPATAFL
jgi:MoaA/NifB/PqqE/SkfB family radical SAM enzyme